MRSFRFGEITTTDIGGTRSEYSLHVKCPWRLDGPDGIITGRADLWDHISGELMPDEWKPQINDNVQDVRIGELLKGFDLETHSHINVTDYLAIESVEASDLGDVTIGLSGGYRLTLFPGGSKGEDWRFFRPGVDEPHKVMEAGVFSEQ